MTPPTRLQTLFRRVFYPEQIRAERRRATGRRREAWLAEWRRQAKAWTQVCEQIRQHGSVTVDDAGRLFDPFGKSDDE